MRSWPTAARSWPGPTARPGRPGRKSCRRNSRPAICPRPSPLICRHRPASTPSIRACSFCYLVGLAALGCEQAAPEPVGGAPPAEEKAPLVQDRVAGKPWKQVLLVRTPDGGIQPQALEHKGQIHLVYFKGDPAGGDVFYVK